MSLGLLRLQSFRLLLLLSGCSALLWSGELSTLQLRNQLGATRQAQLWEFYQAAKPGYDSYLSLGTVYFPRSNQVTLRTGYGEHEGFVTRQRLALYLSDSLGKTDYRLGLNWWIERQGWDQDDFLFFPHYGKFALMRNVHTIGMTLTDPVRDWGAGAGVQWSHHEMSAALHGAEEDSLWIYGHGLWGPLGGVVVLHGTEVDQVQAHMEFQNRQLRGGDSTGWRTYLPDFSLFWRRGIDDGVQLGWLQNVYHQQVYVNTQWYPEQRKQFYAGLQGWTDGSHLLGTECGAYRDLTGQWHPAFSFLMPFLRVSYGMPQDAEELFGLRGQWIVEFQIKLGSQKTHSFFGLNATKPAPMETETLEGKKKDPDPIPRIQNANEGDS